MNIMSGTQSDETKEVLVRSVEYTAIEGRTAGKKQGNDSVQNSDDKAMANPHRESVLSRYSNMAGAHGLTVN